MSLTGLVLLIVLFLVFQLSHQATTQPNSTNSTDKELIQFITVFRHGDRTPTKVYPFECMTWPWGEGVLTIKGMMRAFHLGQSWKAILGSDVTPSDIQMYSDVNSRTIDTANSILLGFFMPNGTIVSENLNACQQCRPDAQTAAAPSCLAACMNIEALQVPTIPLVSLNEVAVTAISQKDNCKGYQEWYHQLEDTPGYQYAHDITFTSALAKLIELNGGDDCVCRVDKPTVCKTIKLKTIENCWNNLVSGMSAGQTYADGYSNEELYDTFTPVVEYLYHGWYPSSQGTQVGGILLDLIYQILSKRQMQLQKQNANLDLDKRNIFFSGHDHTIFGLLSAMEGTGNAHLAHYTSHVTFSLFSNGFIEIRYDGVLFDMLGCIGGRCKLDAFLSAMAHKTMPVSSCIARLDIE